MGWREGPDDRDEVPVRHPLPQTNGHNNVVDKRHQNFGRHVWQGCVGWFSTSNILSVESQVIMLGLLHLMCRSHVQSGPPQLNDMLVHWTDKRPRTPPV